MGVAPKTQQTRWKTIYYWTLLFTVLFVADDAAFGWFFWLISQVNPIISAATALIVYWSIGYWLTLRGLADNPGQIASWLLRRLQLERKNLELQRREQLLRARITSVLVSVPMSLVLGGVVTTLWLQRRGIVTGSKAKKLGFWLSGIYAVEFALIHALGIGGLIFWIRQ